MLNEKMLNEKIGRALPMDKWIQWSSARVAELEKPFTGSNRYAGELTDPHEHKYQSTINAITWVLGAHAEGVKMYRKTESGEQEIIDMRYVPITEHFLKCLESRNVAERARNMGTASVALWEEAMRWLATNTHAIRTADDLADHRFRYTNGVCHCAEK